MLKQLRIHNIILVEKAEIGFEHGLNTLTGESGSGKSAILYGLNLVIGERTDTAIIRKGCEKGYVEALFECNNPSLIHFLKEGGIEHEHDQELIIRREIFSSGKGRVFINNQPAQLSFLRKLGLQLVQVIGQRAAQRLFSLDYHRTLLDLFGNLSSLISNYQECFENENELQKTLSQFTHQESQRLREIAVCQRELEELDEAQLKEGEDEELFAEYTLLVNAEEVSSKINEIIQSLSGDRQPILVQLNRQKQHLESLLTFDPTLQETYQAFHNALLELQETSHTFRLYRNKLQANPERLRIVNERLTLLNRLKKKFGPTVEEILKYYQLTKAKLFQLEHVDLEIEHLQQRLQEAKEKTDLLVKQLTLERKKLALTLEKALTEELRSLNMPKAVFRISISSHKRTKEGEDLVEFFLSPNVGEHQISLKEHASGGEISRVLLALQTLLAGKEKISTLIFDEVDGNIGGETATIVGDKLRQIATLHQVICITHFPQVAGQANFHLQISKEEKEGRTHTLVRQLDPLSRQRELARMAGIKS